MIDILVTNYGPIGFGLVALLIIWKVIAEPQIKENRVDMAALKDVALTLSTAITTLGVTAQSLERVVNRLENLEKHNES